MTRSELVNRQDAWFEARNRAHSLYERNVPAGHASLFLSHSSKDDDIAGGVVEILSKNGGNVYADHNDKDLHGTDDAERIAGLLRRRISLCEKFVALISLNTNSSRWIPWEFGLHDGLNKGQNNIALFPVNGELSSTWDAQGYLRLYPQIFTPLE